MNKTLLSKILALGIIVLFIVVGIHPSFAMEDKASIEFINLPVSIYTSNGNQRYTLELTKHQLNELGNIFDKLKDDLWNSNNYIEEIESQKESIISLGENGLLPDGVSIEELQDVIIGNKPFSRFGKIFTNLLNPLSFMFMFNIFCQISGESTYTHNIMYATPPNLEALRPVHFGEYSEPSKIPAVGWIHTLGLFLSQNKEGTFIGRIRTYYADPFLHYYIGAIGFNGVIYGDNNNGQIPSQYTGRASIVFVSTPLFD